jgi:DNA-binding SARP family transcriptional activator
MRIVLRFFGRPRVFVDGQALGSTWWWQSKGRELFWYALAHGTQGFTRAEACADLYPDLDGEAASRALRNVLYELRKLIAAQCGVPGSIASHQGRLQLLPGDLGHSWETDLHTLVNCLHDLRDGRMASIDLALLLDGPFLADLTADWTQPFRRYWEQEAMQALELAADRFEAAGRIQEALACLRRELEFCPDEIALVRRVMVLCHTAGDAGGLRAAYLQHCRAARDELDVPPEPSVVALYDALTGA